ncbi:hypothetical protein Voc01_101560 [Virgisporangium ochraceum]|uniref:Uncharacterized protein n=1 Tax=Virgisporangium ochraceum TaxID=65505 RepID=A0A8J4A3L6_9ACTN|nr:hypothetical protein Voc01_101560 [Virgisporangium ochraceum]
MDAVRHANVSAVTDELLVTIVDPTSRSGDDLRSIRGWLAGHDELRGRVDLRAAAAPADALGPLTDALVVAAPLAAAVVPALISWIRSRHTDISLTISRADGTSVELTAQRVRRLGADELRGEVDRIVRGLESAERTEPMEPTETQ